MRSQRHHEEEHDNHERWVISYADFITLLFAFFVVMYAISSVNEGKYRILSDSLENIFNNTPQSMRPIEVGPSLGYGGYDPEQVIDVPFPRYIQEVEETKEEKHAGILEGGTEEISQIAGEIRASFPEFLKEELINLGESESWLEIEINNSLLFASGDATPNPAAVELIRKIAEPLMKSTYPVNIEGFTDNVPIQTQQFPSNWELSAARAAAIVRIMVDSGMKPQRLAAIGYGEYKPVASNETEEGRQRNRRVVMLLTKPTNRFEETATGLQPLPGSPDGPLAPVRLPGGGLLFTSDPPVGTFPDAPGQAQEVEPQGVPEVELPALEIQQQEAQQEETELEEIPVLEMLEQEVSQ